MPTQTTPLRKTLTWTLFRNTERLGFLLILFLITTSHYLDENILSVLLEPIKHEFAVSDTELGLLVGFCFSLIYAIAGFPLALWADRGDRRKIITLAVAGWSLMTALCGIAHSFVQLALARFGIGALASAGIPLSQSLVADYFPPARRAMAATILITGASGAGWLIALGLGGVVSETYGWRIALVAAGIPGLLLASIARWVLREPRHELGFPATGGQSESIQLTFLQLRRKRSLLFGIGAVALCATFGYGVAAFIPSFLIRSFHATVEQRSEVWGTSIAASNIVGALTGGWIADRASGDIRWYARIPAIACMVAMPLYALAFLASSFWMFICFQFLADFTQSAGVPVALVAISVVCGRGRRALAISLTLSIMMLVGGTLGPLVSGALSDALHAARGAESLRYSLAAMCIFQLPAAALFYLTGRSMLQDEED